MAGSAARARKDRNDDSAESSAGEIVSGRDAPPVETRARGRQATGRARGPAATGPGGERSEGNERSTKPRTYLSGASRRRTGRRKERARGPQKPEDRVGELLSGTYRIERLIAMGGMGSVFEVSHTRLQQHFAVKFLDAAFVNNEEAYSRFRQEAEIAARLNHGAVVQVFDFNMDQEGNPFMVMELVDGQTLDACAAERKDSRLGRDEVLGIFRHLCEALDDCHDHDIVHRDLKPSNIVVQPLSDVVLSESAIFDQSKFWKVKLLDFGISKIKSQGDDDGMTRDNVVMGTPNYMSPEQAQGFNKNLDRRTDIFSLGAILYEMLSGRRAFDGDNLPQILHSIVYDEPPPLKGIPSKVVAVVARAMAKDASDRFERAGDMLDALQTAYRVEKPAPAQARPAQVTSPATMGLVWALSVAITGAGTYTWANHRVNGASSSAHATTPAAAVAASGQELGVQKAAQPEPPVLRRDADGDGYDVSFVGKPGARMLVDDGQLYRADASGLSFWTDSDAKAHRKVLPSTAGVTALGMTNDGRELLVGQSDGTLTRWDRNLRERLDQSSFGASPITTVAGGAGYLAVATRGKVRLLAAATGRDLKTFKVGSDPVALAITRHDPTTLVIFSQSAIRVIDADRRRVLLDSDIGVDIEAGGVESEKIGHDPVLWIETRRGQWVLRTHYKLSRSPGRKNAARLDVVSHRRLR